MTTKHETPFALDKDQSAKPEKVVGVGGRLAKIRGRDVLQKDFAKVIGVHFNTYARWEREETDISALGLLSLARLGWNPMWVLTGEGPERLSTSTQHEAAVDAALAIGLDDKAAQTRRDARLQGLASGLRIAGETASDSRSQPMRQTDAVIDTGLLAKAKRIADEVLTEEGIRHLFKPPEFADFVQIVYDDLAHGYAAETAAQTLESLLSIASKKPGQSKQED